MISFLQSVPLSEWPQWVLAAVTLAMVVVIGWQAIETRRAAKATQKSAEAARATADAYILAERPWLLVPPPRSIALIPAERQARPRATACHAALKNFGRTPGRVTAWRFELQIGDRKDTPPDPSIYGESGALDEPTLVIPNAEAYLEAHFRGERTVTQEEVRQVQVEKTKSLWLCGFIEYEDTFRPGVLHRCDFCYIYEPKDFMRDGFWHFGGPAKYSRAS